MNIAAEPGQVCSNGPQVCREQYFFKEVRIILPVLSVWFILNTALKTCDSRVNVKFAFSNGVQISVQCIVDQFELVMNGQNRSLISEQHYRTYGKRPA